MLYHYSTIEGIEQALTRAVFRLLRVFFAYGSLAALKPARVYRAVVRGANLRRYGQGMRTPLLPSVRARRWHRVGRVLSLPATRIALGYQQWSYIKDNIPLILR